MANDFLTNTDGINPSEYLDSILIFASDDSLAFKKIWDAADKVSRPVVSGVYFVSKAMETTLMTPMPTIFMDTEDEFQVEYIHPLPVDSLIKVDSAGMGLVLMHKSIVPKLREGFPSQNLFQETDQGDGKFIGEDISFFRKLKKVGIEVYAHTGALAQHMKRFSYQST